MGAFDDIFTPFIPEPEPQGVWAIVDRDYNTSITAVYPTEIDALRVINGREYGKVVFVPWGKTLADIEED